MSDVFDSLSRDHREVASHFARYAETGDDAIAREICAALTLHTQIEEQVLYPELRRIVDDGDDLADTAEAEHAAVKVLIERVYEAPPADLRPLIAELRTQVEQHVSEEETQTFPKLRAAGANAETLGAMLDEARQAARERNHTDVGS